MCRITTTKLIAGAKDKLNWPQKICFCVNLKTGLNIWLAVESVFWFVLFLVALYYQVSYVAAIDLRDFGNVCNDSYFRFFFGSSESSIDKKLRLTITVANFLVLMFFLVYFFCCFSLAIGINKKKLRWFIPYFTIDAIAVCLIAASCSGIIFEPSTNLVIAFVIFFLIKVYIQLCLISLYKVFQKHIKASARVEMAKFLGESKKLFQKP